MKIDRLLHPLLSLLLVLAAACGEPEAGPEPAGTFDTPEAAFAAIQAACRDRDTGRLYDLSLASDRKRFEDMRARAKDDPFARANLSEKLDCSWEEIEAMDPREFATFSMAKFLDSPEREVLKALGSAELTKEPEVEGKRCELTWRSPESGEGRTGLKYAAGGWRLSLMDIFVPSEARVFHSRSKAKCMNNLRHLGALLMVKSVGGQSIYKYSGPAFLLQVAEQISDEHLDVYLCSGEPVGTHPVRPEPGTDELVQAYRSLAEHLSEAEDIRLYTSYAGANWKDHPRDPASQESRAWACCPHHKGVVVLWDTSKVTFIEEKNLKLGGPDGDRIILGADSPDPRLRTVMFNPER